MSSAPDLPSAANICIVGAGPSGLALALSLAARKIPFTIVDALEEGHSGSRSVAVQSNGLEALHTVSPQLVADIVAAGMVCRRIRMLDGQARTVLDLGIGAALEGKTRFPFYLTIPQRQMEALMREHLQRMGASVHWRRRVSGMRPVDSGSRYELQFDSGETLTAKYVVAADGANSFVRDAAGIRYLDPRTKTDAVYEGKDDWDFFVVADVELATPLPRTIPLDRIQMRVGRGALVLTAPFRVVHPDSKEDVRIRLYLGVPRGADPPPRKPDAAYIQALVDNHGTIAKTDAERPKIVRVLDSARFRATVGLAEQYLVRAAPTSDASAYVLLAGDSAHRHGPAGGQGLNVGVCDGCELGDAFAAVLSDGGDAAEQFTAYSNRRRGVAQRVISMVLDMTAMEASGPGWVDYFRTVAVWAACKVPFIARMMILQMSGVGDMKR
ncbi:FAD/NAD(P)-binding domain-containing protein [Mycena kentingensis (nom. inval.)]|nr:FAD/NAD(P)-binding domain-containing protein [Mycena kentingensis (nom. inval.)]